MNNLIMAYRSNPDKQLPKKRALISTFNMYKGGSKSIYSSLINEIKKEHSLAEIGFKRSQKETSKNFFSITYPIKKFNFLYRILIEHFYVPIVALLWRSEMVIMLGNFPSFFWFKKQNVFFHNSLYINKSSQGSFKFLVEQKLFEFLIFLKRPNLLVQTEVMKERLKGYFPFDLKVDVIGTPFIDIKVKNKSYSSKDIISSDFEVLRLIYPAFLYPHKNHGLILKNASIFCERKIEIILTIDRPENFPAIKFNESIKFIGEQSKNSLYQIYENVDGLIFPSLQESLGVPLLEAVQLGIPVIAPNLPYVNSIITNYYGFDPKSSKSFCESIQLFADDYRARTIKLPKSNALVTPDIFLASLLS